LPTTQLAFAVESQTQRYVRQPDSALGLTRGVHGTLARTSRGELRRVLASFGVTLA
jgi:hypothetical protein